MEPGDPGIRGLKGDRDLSVDDAVSRYCDSWLPMSNRSPKTIAAYRTDLRQFQGCSGRHELLRSIQRSHVESWLLHLQTEQLRTSTIRRKLASIRGMFRHYVERGAITCSPLDGFRVRLSTVRPLTRVVQGDQVDVLLRHLKTAVAVTEDVRRSVVVARRDYAMIRLLSATGLRVAELCALNCEDFVGGDGVVLVHGKGGRERLALLTIDEDAACVQQYLALRHQLQPVDRSLFVNARGARMGTEGVRLILRRAAQSAGLAVHLTPHMLRHTAATRLLERGADLRVVQTYLGHTSIRSTERYTHVSTKHLRSVLERCHPLLPAA